MKISIDLLKENRVKKISLLKKMESCLSEVLRRDDPLDKLTDQIVQIDKLIETINELDLEYGSKILPSNVDRSIVDKELEDINQNLNDILVKVQKLHKQLYDILETSYEMKKQQLDEIKKKREEFKIQKKVVEKYYPRYHQSAFFDNKG